MVALKRKPALPAEIVCDPTVMSGEPVVRGTRILAETIAAYLRDGYSHEQIFEDFPTLPLGAIEAVAAWAEARHGPGWMARRDSSPMPPP